MRSDSLEEKWAAVMMLAMRIENERLFTDVVLHDDGSRQA